MTTKTNVTVAALLLLNIASAAQAGVGTPSAATCPALEGYPDCHPDAARALWLHADQQTAQPAVEHHIQRSK
jgi:hypothetical protein